MHESVKRTLHKKILYLELFWSAFSRIWTEYGEILRISLYSVRMRENVGKMRTRITPNTDKFYEVEIPSSVARNFERSGLFNFKS